MPKAIRGPARRKADELPARIFAVMGVTSLLTFTTLAGSYLLLFHA